MKRRVILDHVGGALNPSKTSSQILKRNLPSTWGENNWTSTVFEGTCKKISWNDVNTMTNRNSSPHLLISSSCFFFPILIYFWWSPLGSIRDNYHDSLLPDCFGKSLDLAGLQYQLTLTNSLSLTPSAQVDVHFPAWHPGSHVVVSEGNRFYLPYLDTKNTHFDIQMPFQTEYCIDVWGKGNPNEAIIIKILALSVLAGSTQWATKPFVPQHLPDYDWFKLALVASKSLP